MFNHKINIMKKNLSLLTLICIISAIALLNGCKKATVPTLTTTEVTEITANSAVSGGEITADGGDDIIDKGVCWNTTVEPTISDSKTSNGKGSGIFTSNISGLQSGKTYSVRAYATNSAGTAYGEEYSFNTKLADVDGNQYAIVKIGSQMWMAENLKTTKYNDNTPIPNVTGDAEWAALTTGGYCWYNNDEAYFKPLYGALYNWFAIETGKLCPEGWHVPSDAEYNALEVSLGLPQADVDVLGWRGTNQGAQMKSTTGWNAGENGTNTSGFTALPGGYRFYGAGTFYQQNALGYWWSATQNSTLAAWYRRLDGNNEGVYKGNVEKQAGKSVRCVKD